MKSGGAAKKAKGMYVKDENPALRTVVAGLKRVVKELVPGTMETVNASKIRLRFTWWVRST